MSQREDTAERAVLDETTRRLQAVLNNASASATKDSAGVRIRNRCRTYRFIGGLI